MDTPRSFGSWLREHRSTLDLSRQELARRVSCAVITIKKIETGERRPSRQLAELILDVLAIPPEQRPALMRLARATPLPIAEMLPGAHPFEELELALLRLVPDRPANLNEQLARDQRGLLRASRLILPPDGESELLLLIDQFEELFTLLEDEYLRERFLANLVAAVTDARSRVRVIVTLRADFYDQPLLSIDLGALVRAPS